MEAAALGCRRVAAERLLQSNPTPGRLAAILLSIVGAAASCSNFRASDATGSTGATSSAAGSASSSGRPSGGATTSGSTLGSSSTTGGGPGSSSTGGGGTSTGGGGGSSAASSSGGGGTSTGGASISCPPDGGCTQGLDPACCRGSCADLSSDPENCGSCGSYCPNGSFCFYDHCRWTDGGQLADCSDGGCPQGLACLDYACLTRVCASGDSSSSCAADGGRVGSCCSGACVDTLADASNCGACGEVCVPGNFCDQGTCRSTACPGTSPGPCRLDGGAGGFCCAQGCTDLESDTGNCGACGVACPGGSACVQGFCWQDGGPAFCLYSACPPGTVCKLTRCLPLVCPSGFDGEGCAFGEMGGGTCCGGRCVDTQTDPENCGACGVNASGPCIEGSPEPRPGLDGGCPTCSAGDICIAGQCAGSSCTPGVGSYCLVGDGGLGACCGRADCIDLMME